MPTDRVRALVPWIVLVVVDVLLGWLNYSASDDVQPVAAGLLIAGFGFAFWRPRLAWLLVPLIWLAIPLSSIVAFANNHHPGLVKPHPLYETLIALIPVAIGAAAGYGVRTILVASRRSNIR